MDRLYDSLESLLPTDVSCAAGLVADHTAELFEIERAALGDVVPKRRNEFSSGRVYARAALAALNCPRCPIGVGADRRPNWPSGYIGSISHSSVWCTAVVGRDQRYVGIGVDIESDEPLDSPVRENICRRDEPTGVVDIHGHAIDSAKLIFVLKEAAYKAYHPGTSSFLDFHDLRITIAAPRGMFQAEIVRPGAPSLAGRRRFGGRFTWIGQHLLAAVAIENNG